ncbi:hypothetical protein HanXRQr2_Chr11g0516431 [Helianthus annuus]|uniref:Uncharacterized protein n=1 Tax=Helianthus annuus TaxID=4232 RepID=A0A251TDS3_HELAN|nr:hypothetical protein HanXRQr2_Chr11g0516431 [Helianthus annuus]KAJ0877233.1 hypothetical protein HanPSC8_Chr11g0497741 [Helianthus annuus]
MIQDDNQFFHSLRSLCVTIDSPITRYGQENRNRAARQRIPIRVWKDDNDGVEHVEVSLNNF